MLTFDDIIATANSEGEFLQVFKDALSEIDELFLEAHKVILSACYRNPGLSPGLKGTSEITLAQRWFKKYHNAFQSRISQRMSSPPETVADSTGE